MTRQFSNADFEPRMFLQPPDDGVGREPPVPDEATSEDLEGAAWEDGEEACDDDDETDGWDEDDRIALSEDDDDWRLDDEPDPAPGDFWTDDDCDDGFLS